MARLASWLLPPGTSPDAGFILAARGIRAFTDGYVALLLPFYLTLLGHSAFEVGLIATATLLGSGVLTLLAGLFAYRFRLHAMLSAACVLMLGTGLGQLADAVTNPTIIPYGEIDGFPVSTAPGSGRPSA